jgi:hypothetical protein
MQKQFFNRMVRAAKLEVQLYEEVEADRSATRQALAVVILSSVAAGIARVGAGGMGGFFVGGILSLMGWVIWAYLTYLIGTKLLPQPRTEADLGQLLRTTGFASAPGLLRVFGFIPGTAGILFFVTSIWMLVAMVIAVRQALDYTSTGRAVAVCLIGWIIQSLILVTLFILWRA